MSFDAASGADLRLQHVTKSYGGTHAVADIDLRIPAGEFFTLLGPSGSGKTTTLMLIAGFVQPTSGEIYISGKPVSNVPVHKRNVGVVFQDYGLFPHMTVAQNLAFPLTLRGKKESVVADEVRSILELVQLKGLEQQMPQQLSGGQQQRVALARALVFKPSILLLDEPLSALDKNLREQLQFELKELHRRLGTTIVCVTHDQEEALALSDRVAVLNRGELQQTGTPRDLYESPGSLFVATFIGESNVLSGRVVDTNGERMRISLTPTLSILADRPAQCGEGMPVEIVIRPQHVLIGEDAKHVANSFSGVIKNRVYAGDSLKAEVSVDGSLSILAKVPNTAAFDHHLVADNTVTIGFKAESTLVFPMQATGQSDSSHASVPISV